METETKKTLTAPQKRVLRLILDSILLVLLVLMYRKQVISLAFHEIGGLALIGLFLIHHITNVRWIAAVAKRAFAKKTPWQVRLRFFADALLLVAFLTIGVTGVLISEVVFPFRVQGNAQTLHSFASAVAIILVGVHLGLHADYIFGKITRKGANKAAKIILAVVMAAIIAFGCYSLYASSFVEFLTAPVRTAALRQGEFEPQGDAALDGLDGGFPSDLSELPETSGSLPADDAFGLDAPDALEEGGHGGGGGPGQGLGDGSGQGNGNGGNGASAPLLIAEYISIAVLFGGVTYGLLKLFGRKKKAPRVKSAQAEPEAPEALPEAKHEQDVTE